MTGYIHLLGQKDEIGNFRPKYGRFPLHIIHALEYSETTFIDKHFNIYSHNLTSIDLFL